MSPGETERRVFVNRRFMRPRHPDVRYTSFDSVEYIIEGEFRISDGAECPAHQALR